MENQTSSGASRLPKNFFVYHFTYALPRFVKSRPRRIVTEFRFLNIASLTKNLFAPYRRMALDKKASAWDRFSFNFISRGIGAVVRLLLIIFGLIILIIFSFFY